MEIIIMDENFQSLYNLDMFESLIWTERYIGFGDFEICTPINQNILQIVNVIKNKMKNFLDCYAWLKESKSVMIIEDLEITTDVETGSRLTISGRGPESILERRIIWDQIELNDTLQNCIKILISNSIISPNIEARKISNFIFKVSDNEYVNSFNYQSSYNGDNLYDVVFKICESYRLGFDVYLNSDNKFVFTLTYGEDRSYDQTKNQYVIFSPKYENMINSDYIESVKTLKNITVVVTEDQRLGKLSSVIGIQDSLKGLSRREMHSDASDVQFDSYRQQIEDNEETLEEYRQNLSENKQSLDEAIKKKTDIEATKFEENTTFNAYRLEYDNLLRDYTEIRRTSFNDQIIQCNSQINAYEQSLNTSQHESYSKRGVLIQNITKKEEAIEKIDNTIDNFNNNIENDRDITSSEIGYYESEIERLEKDKKDLEDQKKKLEDDKSAQEKNLPKYETNLKKYEDRITKYQNILQNDDQILANASADMEKKQEEHVKNNIEYDNAIVEYEDAIKAYRDNIVIIEQSIQELERIIYLDVQTLYDLYCDSLYWKGLSELSENTYTQAFTSEIEPIKSFIYGKDFFKGDVVQIVNEYGIESTVRVSEIVRSQDVNGYKIYPTFEVVT